MAKSIVRPSARRRLCVAKQAIQQRPSGALSAAGIRSISPGEVTRVSVERQGTFAGRLSGFFSLSRVVAEYRAHSLWGGVR